jgi:hypothetical protein
VNPVVGQPQTIQALEEYIAPLRARLAAHPLYASIQTVEHLRIFMESHVFAVWDFMCLLKSLQRALTSVDTLWVPSRFPASRRFINEIVLGEESDEYQSRPLSHFEIYLEAMERAGADASAISRVIETIRSSPAPTSFETCLSMAPPAAADFVRHTLQVIHEGSMAAQAAAFTFGREDAIPDMFRSLVRDLNATVSGDLSQIVWYLERHIEVDGDEHGPLSLRMVEDLCGNDPELWAEAVQAADTALRSRLALWDAILEQIRPVSRV